MGLYVIPLRRIQLKEESQNTPMLPKESRHMCSVRSNIFGTHCDFGNYYCAQCHTRIKFLCHIGTHVNRV